jgi:hypothetical protein
MTIIKEKIRLPGILMTSVFLVISLADLNGSELPGPRSQWVFFGSDGKLVYKALEKGDKIIDFSSAGYMGGGVAIPAVPVTTTIMPTGKDDTDAIQNAIDALSKQTPVNGFRGAVLLGPGIFNCSKTLNINSSGVVLRGSGAGKNGTTIKMDGTPHSCISIRGRDLSRATGNPTPIAETYLPSGTNSFHIENTVDFKAGDAIMIKRPVTEAWVRFMLMDDLVRDGRKEIWLSVPSEITCERLIKAISGNLATIDIPMTDSYDAKYLDPPGCSIVKYEISGRISQVGVEDLRIISPPQEVELNQRHNGGIRISGVCDSWIHNVAIDDTVGSIGVGSQCRRITVENVIINHSVATKGAAKPADFAVSGSQILLNRCNSTGNNLFYFVTQARVTGPIVLLNCVFHGNGSIQPHQRWATGLLVDGCQVPESGIEFSNRGEMGSGHGWTIGWAVAWNCVAKRFVIQEPPGSTNWAIGCTGAREQTPRPFGKGALLPEGIFDSHGTPVVPASLYLAQLRERLGPRALKNIGY